MVFAAEDDDILFPRTDLDHGAQLSLKTAVFHVKADLQNDVYHLYANNNVYVNIAYIGSIALSKYMNSLFRNIRENDNIDYGEESEDEDTFQNVRPDKYVDLQKSYNMNCVYHAKFKKWVPVNVVPQVAKCVDISLLVNNRNKYFNNSAHNKTGGSVAKTGGSVAKQNTNKTYNKPYNKPYTPFDKTGGSVAKPYTNKTYNKPYNKSYNKQNTHYSKYGSSVNSST